MKNKTLLLLCGWMLMAGLSCSKNKETIADVFEIETENLNKSIDRNVAQLTIPVSTTLGINDWNVETTVNWLFVSKKQDAAGATANISVTANSGETRKAEVRVTSTLKNYTINITQFGRSEVIVEADVAVKPYGGRDSEHQPGQDISNTYDNKFSADGGAPFHTPWGVSAKFPVTLEYYFRGDTEIDYLIYHTRAGNGNFGELEVWTATDEARQNYVMQGAYDFKQQNAPSKVTFASPVKATGVKFIVKSGLGNFVSCDEMCFYKKNTEKTLDKQLLTVFKDITCTAVKDGVTQDDINALPDYFIRVAQALQHNTYDEWEKEFRVQEYAPYSNVEEWADRLMTKRYSNLDNLTGIYVEKGDEVIVLVGDTHGQDISLQCIGEENMGSYVQTAGSGDSHFLEQGVNKLTMRNAGQLFIMYHTDLTLPQAKPVKIHIPLGSGRVTGFFDLKRHKTDARYAELLGKATHKYFGVRGERIMFYFHRTKMMDHVRYEILSAINLWDNFIAWQQELMGIDDVRPARFNNRIMAISPEGSYMWASDYRIGFTYSYLGNILLYDNVMAAEDNAWGPAHEIGHIHQAAINWPGSTESSNNLFSNYTIYKLGKYGSRGRGLCQVAQARHADGQAWWNMGNSTHQNEDTEVHMRMNWQLWTYFHRCEYQTNFWPKLFKLLREDANRVPENNPGLKQITFAMMASKAANTNLTEFFDQWGFFEPVNQQVSQYGTYNYVVTESMIKEAKAYMSQFPAPKHALQYIEDRRNKDFPAGDYRSKESGDVGHYTQFKQNTPITKTPTYTQAGRTVTVHNGEEAVAFEWRQADDKGKICFFANTLTFNVPENISLAGAKLYAVQADGKRLEIKR